MIVVVAIVERCGQTRRVWLVMGVTTSDRIDNELRMEALSRLNVTTSDRVDIKLGMDTLLD
jgi:hypothetical protein